MKPLSGSWVHIKIGLLVTFSHALPARVDIKVTWREIFDGNDVVRGAGLGVITLWYGAHLKKCNILILHTEFLTGCNTEKRNFGI